MWTSAYLPNIGGLEVMTHTLAKALVANGHEVLVISNRPINELIKEIVIEGIKVFNFPIEKSLLSYDLKSVKAILDRLNQVIAAFSPDVVHIHGFLEQHAFYQERLFRKTPYPICLTLHGLLVQSHFKTDACQKLWRRAKQVTIVSKSLEKGLFEEGLTHPNLKVVYNALTPPHKSPVDFNHNTKRILLMGRISKEKGFEFALQAFQKLKSSFLDLHIDILAGGSKYQELLDQIRLHDLESITYSPGFIQPDEVWKYVDNASLILVPSTYEAFGLVALQGAMRKRPVVASNILGLREVIVDKKTGLLVPPGNPDAIVEAISQLLTNPTKSEKMGIEAYNRSKKLFDVKKMVNTYQDIYSAISSPLVSVVIPTYNGEKHLSATLYSVFKQTYSNFEVIIVDNGSSDQTSTIAKRYENVRYQSFATQNTADARNRGVKLAKGKYIAFLDQDDLWETNKLELQVTFLEENPDFDAAICHQTTFLDPGTNKPHWLKREFLEGSQLSYNPSSLLVKKTLLDQNTFDLAFSLTSDVAWFFQAKHQGLKIGELKDILMHRRVHLNNGVHACSKLQKELLHVIKDSLKQRRKNG